MWEAGCFACWHQCSMAEPVGLITGVWVCVVAGGGALPGDVSRIWSLHLNPVIAGVRVCVVAGGCAPPGDVSGFWNLHINLWSQAFGSVSSLEAAYFRETGKQLLLSEQNLMDCAWDYGNTACLGGCAKLQHVLHRSSCVRGLHSAAET